MSHSTAMQIGPQLKSYPKPYPKDWISLGSKEKMDDETLLKFYFSNHTVGANINHL